MTMNATLDRAPAGDGMVREHHGRAMGTHLHLLVVGGPTPDIPADPSRVEILLSEAVKRVRQLEARWSRFLPDSEMSRCNSTRGIPVDVSADTRSLVRHAIHGWHETNGAYDPTVLDALVANGYDRSYERILAATDTGDDASSLGSREPMPAPGCDGIVVDDDMGSVTLPVDAGFDPGGIGKGLAADMVVDELMSAGAKGAMVNLGGDIRFAGEAPTSDGWVVEIHEPSVQEDPVGLVVMVDGGLATSTTRRRVWTVDGATRHHVIDPRIGKPVESQAQLATVITGQAWWSEIVATHLLLSPTERWAEVTGDSASLVVDINGDVHTFGTMKDHLR